VTGSFTIFCVAEPRSETLPARKRRTHDMPRSKS